MLYCSHSVYNIQYTDETIRYYKSVNFQYTPQKKLLVRKVLFSNDLQMKRNFEGSFALGTNKEKYLHWKNIQIQF